MKVKLINKFAKLPVRASAESAGADVSSVVYAIIPAGGFANIQTGISVKAFEGHYVQVMSRSGLWFKHRVSAEAGVIDRDYTGEVVIGLHNRSEMDFEVKVGDRIAQLVELKVDTSDVEQVESLEETDRGSDGFGSTGIE